MSKSFKEDLTGKRFGRLTVIKFTPTDNHHTYWKCKCDCGNITTVTRSALKAGDIVSCGCYRKENARFMFKYKHGISKTRQYRIWQSMIRRCYDKEHKSYKFYGAKGITVCDEWKNDATAFYNWAMKNGYQDNLTLDRIDGNCNYAPNNCRWITMKEQQRHRSNNVFVILNGVKMTLAQASEVSGIHQGTLRTRYTKGERGETLFRPVKNKIVVVEYNGEKKTLLDISRLLSIPYYALRNRYYRGDRGDRLFRPVKK